MYNIKILVTVQKGFGLLQVLFAVQKGFGLLKRENNAFII